MGKPINIHADSGSFPPTQSHLSNITLSQDPSVTASSMFSTSRMHYPSHPHYGRPAAAQPPALGEVMHRADGFFKEKTSETSDSYEYQYLKKPVLLNVHAKLSATNFKMDRDLDKFKSFKTTHDDDFIPLVDDKYERTKQVTHTSIAHIQQGDLDKIHEPLTDYKEKFQGHDPRQHPMIIAPRMGQGITTIKGDPRLINFETSTGDQFPEKIQSRVKSIPPSTITNIPKGDQDKILMGNSVTVESFPYKGDAASFIPYNREAATTKQFKSSLNQTDEHGLWNDYTSMSMDHFTPKYSRYVKFLPTQDRNHSDFPEGDRHKIRDTERISSTTNNLFFGNPALGLHNRIIRGANLRTRSNVTFGDPAQEGNFYTTSTGIEHVPKSTPYTYDRTKFHWPNNIPVKYYDKWEPEATMTSDYKTPRLENIINTDYLAKQKGSSILLPEKNAMFFQTTHRDFFTPKRAERYSYDSGRNQKSSIPIGTLLTSSLN